MAAMNHRTVRAFAVLAVLTAAFAPVSARAGDGCRAISDARGDLETPVGLHGAGLDPGTGTAADLTGFAIYPAGWGDIVAQIAVADIEAPVHPLADSVRYTVTWTYGGKVFTLEALRAEMGWSYAAWARSSGVTVNPDSIQDLSWPVSGMADPAANTITLMLSQLALGEGGAMRLTDVAATAEEIRRIGVESATGGAHRVLATATDHAPDTASGVTEIDLHASCPEIQWAGATEMCRVVEDARGDAAPTPIGQEAPGAADLTGVFVQSTDDRFAIELGVADTADAAAGTVTRYAAQFDVDGSTYLFEAVRDDGGWRYRAGEYATGVYGIPVDGSVAVDRIRFEIDADEVRPAFRGMAMRSFAAATEHGNGLAGEPLVPVARDAAPDGGAPSAHTLGLPCPTG